MKRRLDLDALRIIAIVFVIVNHTATNTYISSGIYNNGDSPFIYFLYLLCAALARVAVPVFFIISGIVLIPKQESIADLYKKRVLKYVLIIIVFSAFQYFYHVYLGDITFSVTDALGYAVKMYTSSVVIPYWFLYAYLGFLIMLPFIRLLVSRMTRRHFSYLIILHLVFFSALQIFEYFFRLERVNVSVPLACETSLFYSVMGYYLDSVKKLSVKQMSVLGGVSLFCILLSVGMVYWQISIDNVFATGSAFRFSSALIVFPASFIFLLCKRHCNNIRASAVANMLHWVAGTTFGLYLLEAVFEQLTFDVYFICLKCLPPFLSWVIWVASVILVAVAAISVYNMFVLMVRRLRKAAASRKS